MAKSIEYYPGDGTTEFVPVAYLADFPRGEDGTCAYCHADPLAERTPPHPRIADYYRRNPRAETCPMCDGRPT